MDHQTRLQLEGDVQISIEGPFDLSVGGTTHALDPVERGSLGPVLAVYPASVSSLSIAHDATLRIEFDSGATISVPPDESGEAWRVAGPGQALVVCNPGTAGELSVWT